MTSIGARFAARATSGFDYARLGLALGVIVWHTFTTTMGNAALTPYVDRPVMVLVRVILPMFFALSGFLVSSSLERAPSLGIFLWHRFLRIFPALSVEVVLSAFVLGPLLTTVALSAYFTDAMFFKYIANVFGWIHFRLPGVFADNPVAGIVNSSLWTVPSELECYIAISVLFVIGIFRNTRALFLVYVLGVVAYSARQYQLNEPISFNVDQYDLTLSFVAGMLIYRLRDRLPGGVVPASIALLTAAVLLYFPLGIYIASFPAAYAVAAFGCTRPWRSAILFGGDYSYGLYLYAYPIQQTVVHLLGPGRFWATLGISLLVMIGFGVFSWHVIEKNVLKYKNSLPRLLGHLRSDAGTGTVARTAKPRG